MIETKTLRKTTHYARSISLTQEEFDAAASMELEAIEIFSPVGKLVRRLTTPEYSRALATARLNLVDDDPEKKHYWVVRF